ncbi:MAG TPA: RNA 2',3'-cyclic phosphodiesterase, partial [Candidatus Bathyarchaeota archaeon]|nr:RNA 2',3'-cyclic phosphodiesterase [Candidatus Bathyarchaeota archaeon]
MSGGTIRSFIAIDVEDQEIVRRLVEAQSALAETGAKLKLVEPQNIHITLWFLGNITGDMVDRIHEQLKAIEFRPFVVEVYGVGAFPNP